MAKKRVILVAQIVLATLMVVGIVWIALKLFGYNQAQQVYRDMEAAYASELDTESASCPVDFDSLRQQYPDVVGWLQMDDVDVSYAIVQGEDNDYYLHYDPSGEASIDGAIFLDHRNESIDDDKHVIVYGHNMMDESMFGQLDNYASEQFFNDGSGTFSIFTPQGGYTYRIFSAAIVDPTDETYTLGFKDAKVFDAFVKQLVAHSMYETGVQATGADQVVTLSTCSASDRLVLSAVRVSEQTWTA